VKPALIIMAAGIGSRFGGLKQVEPVGPGGELVIEYSIYDALRAGFGKVIFLIREEMLDLFREKVGRRVERQVETDYAFQRLDDLPQGFSPPPGRVKPWGTAHAAINADDFYGRETFAVVGAHLAGLEETGGRLEGCMAGFVLGNTLSEHGSVARGVCQVGADGFLNGVREHLRIQRIDGVVKTSPDGRAWQPLREDTPVSMNLWGFTPGIFDGLAGRFAAFLERNRAADKAEFYLPEAAGELIAAGCLRVRVLPTAARWFGVTYPADLPLVRRGIQALVEAGEYPQKLWA
jgi:hypothetical protein